MYVPSKTSFPLNLERSQKEDVRSKQVGSNLIRGLILTKILVAEG